jgi:GNAT superfamily N-acetyltransferase
VLEIRFAIRQDAPTILGFVRALAEYERQPNAVELDETSLSMQLEAMPRPFECLIAELSGKPVGFALFFHSYSTWRGKRGIWIEDLFVLPEARRHGVGKALFTRVATLARERDCARLEWSVLDWNEPALSFYRSLGAEVLESWRICRLADAPLSALAAP